MLYVFLALDFTVYHEGHRKRYLHSPWVARDFVPRHPDLQLVADLSHWICVAETDTTDPVLTQTIADVSAGDLRAVMCGRVLVAWEGCVS